MATSITGLPAPSTTAISCHTYHDTRVTLPYYAPTQKRIFVKYYYHVNGKIINPLDKLVI
jgi:hypothetical protein